MTKLKVSSLLLLAAILIGAAPSFAKPQAKQASSNNSDVVIKKNADGTVEVSDGDNQPAQPSGGITYKPAPPGTTHYGDGVVVRRNADGSVEVMDEDSVHPVMHSLGPVPAPTVKHHASTHTVTKKPVHHPVQLKAAEPIQPQAESQVSWPKR